MTMEQDGSFIQQAIKNTSCNLPLQYELWKTPLLEEWFQLKYGNDHRELSECTHGCHCGLQISGKI